MKCTIDDLETMILFLLDCGGELSADKWDAPIKYPTRKDGRAVISDAYTTMLNIPDRIPQKSYTFDPVSSDGRLATESEEYLLYHPKEIIGSGIEVIMLNGRHEIKWSGFYPLRKRPKHAVAVGKADCWFEYHFRVGSTSKGWQEYHKAVAAIHSSGKPLPVHITNAQEQPDDFNGRMAIAMCSVVEDAYRIGTVLATIKDAKTLIFPVGQEIYQDFFRLREAPRKTPTGRLNPIIHMVAKHFRNRSDKTIEVKQHTRGVEEITVDGMSISLTPYFHEHKKSIAI